MINTKFISRIFFVILVLGLSCTGKNQDNADETPRSGNPEIVADLSNDLIIIGIQDENSGDSGTTDEQTPDDNSTQETPKCYDPKTEEESTIICSPLEITEGDVFNVATLDDLIQVLSQDRGNYTVILEDGIYNLGSAPWPWNGGFVIEYDNIIIRSKSGIRENVIITGLNTEGSITSTHIFNVIHGKNFTLLNLTLGWVHYHAIQIHGENDVDYSFIHNVHFLETGEQMFKVSTTDDRTYGSDGGIVTCSRFEYEAGVGPQWYIGGIDAHYSKDWIVTDNIFLGIRSPDSSLAEHAIHFWSNSENTVVERNKIINCDRGIGFGLSSDPKRGHKKGIIRNNFVYTTRDVGIGLENSEGSHIYNNSVFTENYANSIEYRFSGTKNVEIINNLTSGLITERDGARAYLESNITNALNSWFTDVTSGDLHLSSSIEGIVDSGISLDEVSDDFDGTKRTNHAYDIGADEYDISNNDSVYAKLFWDGSPNENFEGYKILYGKNSQEYDHTITYKNVTDTSLCFIVNDLLAGQKYYFAIKAFDVCGNESELSDEVGFIRE